MKSHYYEAHVTTDPVPDVEGFKRIVNGCGFVPAKLLMQKGKTVEPSDLDMFCTARSSNLGAIIDMTHDVVLALQSNGFKVRRYKIESTLIDSRDTDELHVL
jgi:hypothetical protein